MIQDIPIFVLAVALLSLSGSGHGQIQTDLTLTGKPIQGGLVFGQTHPDNQVFFDDKKIMLSGNGVFLIGFGRNAPGHVALRVHDQAGKSHTQELIIEQRQYDIQHIDGLPKDQVTPPPEDLERIRDDGRLVAAARDRLDDRLDFLVGFQWPAIGPISGVYGSQRVLNGEPRRPHFGVDVAAEVGAEVMAPAPGIVTLAHPDLYFSGGTLIIDHGHGLSSTFLHLSKVEVNVGQRVEQGQLVARVGATGRVTGPHLDWRMNLRGIRLDPQLLVTGLPTGQ